MVRLVEERARGEGKRSVTLGTSRNAAGVAWKSLPWWESRGYRITGEEENDWTRSIGAGVREIRMDKEIPQTTEILLRDVAETDLRIFFEHQRDVASNFMAAFTSRDPADRDAFAAHWKRILNDETVVVKTIMFRRERGRERREVRRQGIRQTGNHLLDWQGILGDGDCDQGAFKVSE